MSASESPGRPRTNRTFSLGSNNSKGSGGKAPKVALVESTEEKRKSAFKRETKANPNSALKEAEPIAAALEQPTLGSLRNASHTDVYGNSIAEPDLSNPTRPRWERPLDTIRSFEAAIDSQYSNRRSYYRQDSSYDMPRGHTNRRSSYYGAGDGYNRQSRFSTNGGYYGNRMSRDAPGEEQNGPPMSGLNRMRLGQQRMHSDTSTPRYGHASGHYGGYPNNGYQQSRDTVITGVSSGSQSDNNAYSTDPSSDNSSVERFTPPTKQEAPINSYGFPEYSSAPQYNPPIPEHGNYVGKPSPQPEGRPPMPPAHRSSGYPQQGYYQQQPTAQAKSNGIPRRVPVGAAGSGGYPASQQRTLIPNARPPLQPAQSEKRKSWIKRTFSRKD